MEENGFERECVKLFEFEFDSLMNANEVFQVSIWLTTSIKGKRVISSMHDATELLGLKLIKSKEIKSHPKRWEDCFSVN